MSSVAPYFVDVAVRVYLIIYLYRSMRRVYEQGNLLTGLKFITLSFVDLVASSIMFAAVALYSYLAL